VSLVKQLAGETILYGMGQILPRIFHFIVFSSYLTYRLNDTPGEYAIYLDLYAYTSILIVIFSFRLDTAYFRYASKDYPQDDAMRTAVVPLLIGCALLLFVGFLGADHIAALLTYPDKGYYVKWFSCIIALDVLALLPMARLRLQSRAKMFVSFKIANVIITVILVLLFLEVLPRITDGGVGQWLSFASSDIDFVFLANLIASALMLLGLCFVYPIRQGKLDMSLLWRMLKYTWPLVIVGMAGSINQFFGVPLQKYFLGEAYDLNKEEAGIYGAVQKIPALLAMVTTAYNYAAEPFFFRNVDHKDKKELFGDIALFFVIVAGGVAIIIFLQLDLIQYVIGSTYREGLYLVPILLIAYLLLGIYYNVSIWYKLSDKTHYGAIIASIGAIITISMSIILLPRVGVIASAYAALACYLVMVLLAYLLGQKVYAIDYPLGAMLRMMIWTIIVMGIGYLLRSHATLYNTLIGVVLFVVYGVGVYLSEKKKIHQYF